MDIAKIRKKIKEESELRKAGKEKAKEETPRESPEIPAVSQEFEERTTEGDNIAQTGEERIESKSEEKIETLSMPVGAVESGKREGPSEPQSKVAQEAEAAEEDIVELLTFNLSKEEFAFRVSDIAEILRAQRVAAVPKMPGYLLGVTSLRGKIIPVIDLKKRLVIAQTAEVKDERKKILILKGSRGPFGAMIDNVKGVIRISTSDIAEPPAHIAEAELAFIEGVVLHNGRVITVVRMEEVANINLKIRK